MPPSSEMGQAPPQEQVEGAAQAKQIVEGVISPEGMANLLSTHPDAPEPTVEDAAVRPDRDLSPAHAEVERMTKLADLNTLHGPIDESKVR